ncbi:unnamed protein product [Caenorhabditis sp. 36 PRJEB53466]|nr:unnamed protein product [Caenorhabditis sp. 36 PRJEB53466]
MRPLPFILIFFAFPVVVLSELHDYDDIRRLTPAEYREQFDTIVDDLSVCEEETNRKLIVLATHFEEQDNFRRILSNNARRLSQIYEEFVAATQRIQTAKHAAQAILANRTQTAQEQYAAAIRLDKQFPLEMSVLLEICATMGYATTKDVIASSLKDIPKTKKLAADLEEYSKEAQATGYFIAQELHGTPYVSRKRQETARKTFLEKFPKAMTVHDHIVKVLNGEEKFRSVI